MPSTRVSAKLALAVYAKEHAIPIISSMGTGNKLHAELFEIADIRETSVCPLCRVMRKELKARGIEHLKVLYSKEIPLKPADDENDLRSTGRPTPGSVSIVPPVAGLLIAGEVIRDLLGAVKTAPAQRKELLSPTESSPHSRTKTVHYIVFYMSKYTTFPLLRQENHRYFAQF